MFLFFLATVNVFRSPSVHRGVSHSQHLAACTHQHATMIQRETKNIRKFVFLNAWFELLMLIELQIFQVNKKLLKQFKKIFRFFFSFYSFFLSAMSHFRSTEMILHFTVALRDLTFYHDVVEVKSDMKSFTSSFYLQTWLGKGMKFMHNRILWNSKLALSDNHYPLIDY